MTRMLKLKFTLQTVSFKDVQCQSEKYDVSGGVNYRKHST